VIPISVVINTKNAAPTLKACLNSVGFADEIIVVDMNSSDDTVSIAKKFTDKIFFHEDVGYADPARNFALSKASHNWILVIDADEVIPQQLQQHIAKIIKSQSSADVYLIPRKNIIFGQWLEHTGWWPDHQPRLFKKGCVSWEVGVHRFPEMRGTIEELPANSDLAIIHYNYPSVESYLNRLNRYTSIQAREKQAGFGSTVETQDLIKSYFSELWKRLFVLQGYKDKTVGVALSFLQASYELVVQLKIWENQGEQISNVSETQIIQVLEQCKNEFCYWLADYKVKNSTGIKRFWWRARRKFRF